MTDRPGVAAGWECKSRFRDMQAGVCVYCGRYIMQPVLWCSHWKGTPQDCIDHIRLRHHVGLSLKPNMSGIFTHVMLFSEHGAQLVHHYRVYGDCVSHGSLCGTSMATLTDFTNRACAEPRSVAKRGRDSSTGPGSSSSRPALSPLPSDLRTTRRRPSGPGKLLGLWPLLRRGCRYHVSPYKILLWIRIPHSRTWSRPSCTQRMVVDTLF